MKKEKNLPNLRFERDGEGTGRIEEGRKKREEEAEEKKSGRKSMGKRRVKAGEKAGRKERKKKESLIFLVTDSVLKYKIQKNN